MYSKYVHTYSIVARIVNYDEAVLVSHHKRAVNFMLTVTDLHK